MGFVDDAKRGQKVTPAIIALTIQRGVVQVEMRHLHVQTHEYWQGGQVKENPPPAQLGGFASGFSSMKHWMQDRKSTRLNSSHIQKSRMPSSA